MSNLYFKVYFNKCSYFRNIQLTTQQYNLLQGHSKVSNYNSTDLILDDDYFDKRSLVSDEARYTIEIKNNICSKLELLKDFKPIEENENIVLLLESPHRSEYRNIKIYNRLIPIGPAQGGSVKEAGGAIKNYINRIINYIILQNSINLNNGNYNFIIMNPIQFQTSLGSIYTGRLQVGLRDKIWTNIWTIQDSNGVYILQKDFENRLKGYKPKLVINSCTYNLKGNVRNLLNNNFSSYDMKHPANNWYNMAKQNII